ncbi:MAG: aquaporin [Myxococcota bacterium]|nr:aquaporin [Myxococcota bacterium]
MVGPTERTGVHGSWPRKVVAEGIGTFALVFVGTGAIVVDRVSGGAIGHVGIALCFGLTVMTMIYAVGDISGAHFNPAVTVGFWSARRLPGRAVPIYLGAQLFGAILASGLLRVLFPAEADLGATRPGENIAAAFVFEAILTFFLMFVILSVATGAKEKGIIAGIAVGSVICFAAILGGPISGASLNPARSLGPAIFSDALSPLWLYVSAPLLGAFLAVGAWWGLGAGRGSE